MTLEPNTFRRHFFSELIRLSAEVQTNNLDPYVIEPRYLRPLPVARRRVKEALVRFLRRRNLHYLNDRLRAFRLEPLDLVLDNLPALEDVYQLLKDEHSRDVLVKVLLFRVLGSERVRMPLNDDRYWRFTRLAQHTLPRETTGVTMPGLHEPLERFDMTSAGWPLTVLSQPRLLKNTFLLEQYAYRHCGTEIAATPGDVVVDAGAFIGDTSLCFAHSVGPEGKVLCFEFVPDNLKTLGSNLDLNPALAERIEVIDRPLWEEAGVILSFDDSGPRSSVGASSGALQVASTTVDEVVSSGRASRVDFIKMDIEGAEPAALRGCTETLRNLRPKLAISVYHNPSDIWTIPQQIHELQPRYDLYLDHFTLYEAETVLFASARDV